MLVGLVTVAEGLCYCNKMGNIVWREENGKEDKGGGGDNPYIYKTVS